VRVEAYGTVMTIKELATISAPDTSLILIAPWDKGLVSAIATAVGRDLFYFNAGGIKTPKQAEECINAGAHGIHVGNAFEETASAEKIHAMSQAVRKAGKKRV